MSQPLNHSSPQHPLELKFLQMWISFLFTLSQKGLHETFLNIKKGYENMFLTNFSFIRGIRLKKT